MLILKGHGSLVLLGHSATATVLLIWSSGQSTCFQCREAAEPFFMPELVIMQAWSSSTQLVFDHFSSDSSLCPTL